MSQYAETRQRLHEAVAEFRCHRCAGTAAQSTLIAFGGHCGPCYAAYCREARSWPDVGNKEKNPMGWAHKLRQRHEAGEKLTQAQIAAYRHTLRKEQERADE